MQDYMKAQRPPPATGGMPPYRQRFMMPQDQVGFYEDPQYQPPHVAYTRPMNEYMPNYNNNFQNVPYSVPQTSQTASIQLHPGAAPYIPAKFVPPPPGRLRPDNVMQYPPNIPPNQPMAQPKKAISSPSPFYLGNNKKQVSVDGIAEEDRKAYGMEKYVNMINMRKKDQMNIVEQGIDLSTIGLRLNSNEYY